MDTSRTELEMLELNSAFIHKLKTTQGYKDNKSTEKYMLWSIVKG